MIIIWNQMLKAVSCIRHLVVNGGIALIKNTGWCHIIVTMDLGFGSNLRLIIFEKMLIDCLLLDMKRHADDVLSITIRCILFYVNTHLK